MNSKTKKIIIALLIVVVVAGGFYLIYNQFSQKAEAGEKNIAVTVVHKDQSSKSFEFNTDAEFLGEVLKSEKLVEGEDGQYGLFIKTADGETIDEGNQEWWCLTKAGGQVNTSADQTPISDGDKYELTLTVGY